MSNSRATQAFQAAAHPEGLHFLRSLGARSA